MSYTTDIKAEISQVDASVDELKVELAALMQICATLNFTSTGAHLVLQIENANTAKRIWKLVKECYGIDSKLSVIKKSKLKKNNIYVIRVEYKALEILGDLGIMTSEGLQSAPSKELTKKEDDARAYLRGSFLASGSINSPKTSNYHMEMSVETSELAKYLQWLLKRFGIPARTIKRRNQEVVYVKASDKISDFLRVIDANQALFVFEDQRIQRDFMNSLTRLDNCELANEVKTMKAAKGQLDDIEWIENYQSLDTLPPKLRDAAMLRKTYPDASLNELCEYYEEDHDETISKSGMKHRLAKIREVADQYRGKE